MHRDYGGPRFAGAVFKVAPNGIETVLSASSVPMAHNVFRTGARQGRHLYGTTTMAAVRMLAWCSSSIPDGTETVIAQFHRGTDGTTPTGGLLEDTAGQFYATPRKVEHQTRACCSR